MQENLAHAARVLWLRIPQPAKRKPKSRKTWKTLDLGRELTLIVTYFDGKTQWKIGDVFTVHAPITDQGVELMDPAGKMSPWTREWKETFKKVRKVTKRKKKEKSEA